MPNNDLRPRLSLIPSLVLLALACSDFLPIEPPPPAPVASVTVSPGTPTILVGTAVQLSAATKDAQGNTLSNRAIAWSSSAEAVATVSAAGLVTGVSVGGPVTITATSEGQLGTAQVMVTAPPPAPVASVTVSPGTPSILVGTAVQLSAATKDAQGNTLSNRAIAWSSSAEAVATVSAAGLVTGVSVGGPVTITATSEGQLGTAQVTVTAPPLPGYSLSLSGSALSVAPGASSPLSTVYLLRTSFTGNVTLSVDSLPTGVTAVFYPVNPASGSSSQFSLSVDPNAVPGTYPNLRVRGVASGLADRTAPLTLTIPVAPFSLSLSSSTLSIVQGAATPTTTVNVVRNDFAGPVTLHVGWYGEDHDVLPPGVTAAFAPNSTTGNSAVLTFTVSAAATPGVHTLFVFAGASTGGWCCIPLTLTVIAATP